MYFVLKLALILRPFTEKFQQKYRPSSADTTECGYSIKDKITARD